MSNRKVPPSRRRYEEAHPSLTVRVPAEVKVKVQACARAEGLSVSEWVQAQAAGHNADAAETYRRGLEEGERSGEARGYAKGLREGGRQGRIAGYRAGILAYGLNLKSGRAFNIATIARHVLDTPGQAAEVGDILRAAGLGAAWARLMRAKEKP